VEATVRSERLAAVFRAQQRRLWGLAYRLTGDAEDADDIVQEAFARLSALRPVLDEQHVGPWLVRVATNLGIDALRRRRRRAYVGPWLPSPCVDAGDALPSLEDPETRYGLAESATFAFLLALEALSPRQRAVLVLRDVLGFSARETAAIVRASEGNVRVLHTRARGALAAYDAARCMPSPELCERHRAVLQKFVTCLLAQDAAALEALLTEDVSTVTDSAGEYTALAKQLGGRARVARFYLTAARNRVAGGPSVALVDVNGLPAVVITLAHPQRRQAPRTLMRCELAADGRIALVHTVLAPRKLARL
jgi:RNA polymerase sigma-70 factor (ECF subfamily)